MRIHAPFLFHMFYIFDNFCETRPTNLLSYAGLRRRIY